MRILTTGLVLLAVASAVGCASEVADGGADLGTGGGTASGGAVGVGGTTGSGGAAATGGGTATGGTTGSTKVDCVEGTTVASSTTPPLVAWDLQDGTTRTDDATTPISGSVSVATTGGANAPYIAASLSPWVDAATGGRKCLDVSAYTGVKFTVSGTTSDLYFKVGVSKADESGSCSTGCSAHPFKQITPVPGSATEVTVLFSELQTATWGAMAPFDNKQVVSLIWASEDKTASKNLTISNVQFVQ